MSAPARVIRHATGQEGHGKYRYLGHSGFKISAVTYGNWLTHGSQVENDQARNCVHAALDAGISTFDTADVYANTMAETVLGEALQGERRESLEIMTKVFGPTGPTSHIAGARHLPGRVVPDRSGRAERQVSAG